MTQARARPVLTGVQLLRGLAASLVVLSHTNTMMSHPEFFSRSPNGFRLAGEFGVAIFFVISGFIIAYVSLDAQGEPRLAWRDFAWRRAVRILPFMWLCVIGYNVLSLVGTHQVEWMAMLRALVLWPIGELKPNVLWSLRHEWLFYLLFALALLGRRRRLWLLLCWFAAPIVARLILMVLPSGAALVSPGWRELAWMVFMGGQNGANLQFAAGFVLGVLRLRDHRVVRPVLPAGLYMSLLGVILSTVLVENVQVSDTLARAMLWTVLSMAVVWVALLAKVRNDWLAKSGIVLGDATFAIYLVHNPTLLIGFAIARRFASSVPLGVLYMLFVVAAVVVGIAAHYLVEAPLIRMLAGRPRKATAPAAQRHPLAQG